ncbi:hypothetical protein [Anaerosporobacter faecicola]|uniref:hypothetical protein n=1 Tax=Anaerosporobacter faecicola TaxID=2718714 RepID=UPI001438E0F7|nr:hypothetical protein [Anaerosporobacter faecicola]
MNIFTDDLDYEDIDFSFFYNEDGEPEEIDEMEEEQLCNIIATLERQIRMLPEHYNIEIWEEYLRVCKDVLNQIRLD